MPPSHGDYVFPPYLPDDNVSVLDETSSGSLSLLRTELDLLLSEQAIAFWNILGRSKSLGQSLDSYLQYARRKHDSIQESQDASHTQQELSRLIFFVFMRMVTVEQDGLQPTAQAQTLYNEWLLDVPKLMDLAILYSPDNHRLVQSLMERAFSLQPLYQRDVVSTAPALASNMQAVCQTCRAAVERLSASTSGPTLIGLADGTAYLHDTSATLAAFVSCYPPAAAPFAGSGGSGVLPLLPPLHDELLPQIASAAAKLRGQAPPPGFDSSGQALVVLQLQHHLRGLSDCLPSLTSLLIVHGLLGLPGAQQQQQQQQQQHHGSPEGPSPAQRGHQLMAALMSVELPQDPDQLEASLLHRTARQFHLADAVRQTAQQGKILLDDVQQEYLFMQLGERAAMGNTAPGRLANGKSSSASQASGQERNIDRILEVLPEYGQGFLAACLADSSNDAEAVIHQLLEGTLPKHLSKMDPHLTAWQPRKAPAPQPGPSTSSAAGASLSWHGILDQKPAQAPGVSAPALSSQPAARAGAHKATARAMALPAADKAAIRAHVDAAQWDEWDDEYDDSFDDLGVVNLDGTADVEGNDEDTWPAKGAGSRPDRQQATASSTSRPAASSQQGRQKKMSRLWVLNGRIYNYRKEGAIEVAGQGQAQELVQAAQDTAQHVLGLGPGGNKPLEAAEAKKQQHKGDMAGGDSASTPSNAQQHGSANSHPSTADRRSHAHKDKHKSAIANHHRKDRAMRKFAGPPV